MESTGVNVIDDLGPKVVNWFHTRTRHPWISVAQNLPHWHFDKWKMWDWMFLLQTVPPLPKWLVTVDPTVRETLSAFPVSWPVATRPPQQTGTSTSGRCSMEVSPTVSPPIGRIIQGQCNVNRPTLEGPDRADSSPFKLNVSLGYSFFSYGDGVELALQKWSVDSELRDLYSSLRGAQKDTCTQKEPPSAVLF